MQTSALLLAIGAAIMGQWLLPQEEWLGIGAGYVAIAVVALLWVLVSDRSPAPLPALEDSEIPAETLVPLYAGSRAQRAGVLVVVIFLTVYAFQHLANNQFTIQGTLTWLGAIAGFLCLYWEVPVDWWERMRQRRRERPSPPALSLHLTRHHLLLLLIFLLAAFMRFFRLDSLPYEMWSDQAEKLYDVYDVLGGMRPIFFPRNTGREAFQFYLTAGIIRASGLDIGFLPLKIGTALTSLVTVPLVYYLAKELYDRTTAAIATALFALSAWHIAISRVGLRFPFTAAFLTPTLFFLFRAFKYGRRNDWLAAGLVLGVGLHTYIPMRMVPPLLVLLVLIKLLLDWYRQRRGLPLSIAGTADIFAERHALNWRFWQSALLGGVASLLVFLPLGRYMLEEPTMFWYRVTTRSLTGESRLPSESWRIFWENARNALLMFNFKGDPVVTNSIPGTPFLGLVSGGLFMLGVVYLLWRLLKWGDRRPIYLLVALFMMLLPSILSLEFPGENPSRVRTGGAIPLAMIIAALPLALLWQQLRVRWSFRGRWLAGAITVVLFAVALRDNYTYYFVRYNTHYHRSVWNASEMGAVARGWAESAGDLDHVYHIPYPHWVDTRLIGLHAGAVPWLNAVPEMTEILGVHFDDPAPKLYILHPLDQSALQTLETAYPGGWWERYRAAVPAGKDFITFYVPQR